MKTPYRDTPKGKAAVIRGRKKERAKIAKERATNPKKLYGPQAKLCMQRIKTMRARGKDTVDIALAMGIAMSKVLELESVNPHDDTCA